MIQQEKIIKEKEKSSKNNKKRKTLNLIEINTKKSSLMNKQIFKKQNQLFQLIKIFIKRELLKSLAQRVKVKVKVQQILFQKMEKRNLQNSLEYRYKEKQNRFVKILLVVEVS